MENNNFNNDHKDDLIKAMYSRYKELYPNNLDKPTAAAPYNKPKNEPYNKPNTVQQYQNNQSTAPRYEKQNATSRYADYYDKSNTEHYYGKQDIKHPYDKADAVPSYNRTGTNLYYDRQTPSNGYGISTADMVSAYNRYSSQLVSASHNNIYANASADSQMKFDGGDRLLLDNVSQMAYNAYKEKYLPEDSEYAKVAWGEGIGGWLKEKADNFSGWVEDNWNKVKWAFKPVGNYLDEEQKRVQRNFWKAGAELYLRRGYNYLTSAWMLEHSLQDNPSNIKRGNDSRIAYLINHDQNFSKAVQEAISNSNGYSLDNKKIGVKFDDGDLSYSIHKSDIYLTGYKHADGNWYISCKLSDIYDFTEIMTLMDAKGEGSFAWNIGKATVANDAAVISQKFGAINPYNVEVEFYIMR